MDYNIYIRNLTEGRDNRKPTQPKAKNTSMTAFKTKGKKVNTSSSGGYAVNMKNFSKIKAAAAGGVVGIVIMAVIETVKKVVQISHKVAGMYAMDTGDYKTYTHLDNIIAGTTAVFHPISQFKNDVVNRRQRQIENEKREQNFLQSPFF